MDLGVWKVKVVAEAGLPCISHPTTGHLESPYLREEAGVEEFADGMNYTAKDGWFQDLWQGTVSMDLLPFAVDGDLVAGKCRASMASSFVADLAKVGREFVIPSLDEGEEVVDWVSVD
jgi:hypothetical protein